MRNDPEDKIGSFLNAYGLDEVEGITLSNRGEFMVVSITRKTADGKEYCFGNALSYETTLKDVWDKLPEMFNRLNEGLRKYNEELVK